MKRSIGARTAFSGIGVAGGAPTPHAHASTAAVRSEMPRAPRRERPIRAVAGASRRWHDRWLQDEDTVRTIWLYSHVMTQLVGASKSKTKSGLPRAHAPRRSR